MYATTLQLLQHSRESTDSVLGDDGAVRSKLRMVEVEAERMIAIYWR